MVHQSRKRKSQTLFFPLRSGTVEAAVRGLPAYCPPVSAGAAAAAVEPLPLTAATAPAIATDPNQLMLTEEQCAAVVAIRAVQQTWVSTDVPLRSSSVRVSRTFV